MHFAMWCPGRLLPTKYHCLSISFDCQQALHMDHPFLFLSPRVIDKFPCSLLQGSLFRSGKAPDTSGSPVPLSARLRRPCRSEHILFIVLRPRGRGHSLHGPRCPLLKLSLGSLALNRMGARRFTSEKGTGIGSVHAAAVRPTVT